MKTTRTVHILAAVASVALLSGACSSSPSAATTGVSTTAAPTTSAPDATDAATATTGPEPVAPASTSEDDPEPVSSECADEPQGSWLVDTALNDPDGGLNVRDDAGVDNNILAVFPAGTEVQAVGDCTIAANDTEWWAVRAATDETAEGWVAARYLRERALSICPAGELELEGQSEVSITSGDFDGDGLSDNLYLGNHEELQATIMQVQFANGGFARRSFDDIVAYASVNAVFRPIGADHDVVMFRDIFGGGASTSRWVFAEVTDCAPVVFGELYQGASVGWGALDYCLTPTNLGTLLWTLDATDGETQEERDANVTTQAWHYYAGSLVEVDVSDIVECTDFLPDTKYLAQSFDEPNVAGITADTLDDLAKAIGDELGASSVVAVGEPVGFDAIGGTATYDLVGLRDDSVGGYRAQIDFQTILDDRGAEVIGVESATVTLTLLCSRGVASSGLCV
ncbi:MAG: SH3 domain-containing protein [Acidimicrobiales bacterium]|nr:SH3 domain-containing protein [Acidimicrobiales bacterium]